jgi:AcrR family transcriptional regulator
VTTARVTTARLGRRAELLDAADRIVRRDGPAATMDAIAREAGITKPILYRHFGDKGGLYGALAERYTGVLLDRLQAALEAGRGRRDRVSRTVDAYLAAIEREPQVYRFLVHSDDAVPAPVRSFTRRLSAQLALGIAQELAVPADRAAAWGHGIVGMVQAAGDWWLEAGPDDERLPREQLVQELTDLLFGAYGTS